MGETATLVVVAVLSLVIAIIGQAVVVAAIISRLRERVDNLAATLDRGTVSLTKSIDHLSAVLEEQRREQHNQSIRLERLGSRMEAVEKEMKLG